MLPGAEETLMVLGRPVTSRNTVPLKAPMALMLVKMLVCWPTWTKSGLVSVAPLTAAAKLLGPTTKNDVAEVSPLTK